MKRFRFSLEGVLKVKRQVEEQRQRELAAAQSQRDQVLMRLGAFEHELRELASDHSRDRGARISLVAEGWYQARHRGLAQGIRELNALLAMQEQLLERARQAAVEAARERRVLEKLEEAQRDAWLQKLNLEEQGFMDELAQRARGSFSLPTVSANGLEAARAS